ncbi:phenylalanine--tRNA ligase subunit alpha [Candidatus Woesearchaeota archaeon CG10_big_fil_rev_8_21_14_0_10_34_12]|nr:MAG: phenylalanine--tRNA ligase subunit alpha [Candidatus Woesearchaeota archaeon CG10_big_fil_rev_8_21_14_0_10_34_12]
MTNNILDMLSLNERKVLPYLNKSLKEICKSTSLKKEAVVRAIEFLSNKKIVTISFSDVEKVVLDVNGVNYLKKGLPERNLLNILAEKKNLTFEEAGKISRLSNNEIQAAIGALKKKAMLKIKDRKLFLEAKPEEITNKTLDEKFLEILPIELDKLKPEEKFSLDNLLKRKNMVKIERGKVLNWEITELGKKLKSEKTSGEELIEQLTPEMILRENWKGKKFRKYDILSKVPEISGGKRHFVNQACSYARKLWAEMGFKEMSGSLVQTSFWNFDALFTAQDHPARELHDTFFLDLNGRLPERQIIERVKQAHEKGIAGSRGWMYSWREEEAKKSVLRTHTTCLSIKTLYELGKLKEKKGKFFAIGKCFRNETIDAGHLFEFNQTEGIVIDKCANFANLLGYLKTFLNKMGFEKIRFRPHFFPYTEPSVEADVYNERTGKWIEILGAGIFRPEVVAPVLGEYIPVLAWGMGFDRLITENYQIKDLRELYENNLAKLRKVKYW